jgi:hypothetical protein
MPPPVQPPMPPPAAAPPPPASPWAIGSSSVPQPIRAPLQEPAPAPAPAPAPVAPKPAAPAAQSSAAEARSAHREHLDLLWFEQESVRRMRAVKAWKSALAEPEDGDWVDGDGPWKTAADASDRAYVARILKKVKPLSAEALLSASADAIDEAGAYSPPLVVMTGELQLTFDELESLKAYVTEAGPLASSDKRLRDAVDAASEALKASWPPSAALAEGLSARIKEAFVQSNRSLPPLYLEVAAERALLVQRLFQKRTILGKPRLRCLFTTAQGATPIPLYLPESLAPQLPMFQRFRATIVAEAQGQQDQYEGHPVALLALALGRLLPSPTATTPGAGGARPAGAR